jgi:hypothetical protein
VLRWDDGSRWDDKNAYWGDPSYVLEPGDPGYLPPDPSPTPKTKPKKRNYMSSNPTPEAYGELLAAGEDLCDGINQHAVAIGLKQNTFAVARADLDAMIAGQNAFKAAKDAEPLAYAALRTADSNGKGFIARAIKVLSITLGNDWSDAWVATGLPDNSVAVPKKQDARFAALNGLKAYFTNHPTKEVSTAEIVVTAALAGTLYTAISDARLGVNNALVLTKDKFDDKEGAVSAFRDRFRGTVNELEQILEDEDPKWYDFGLNRPIDPAQPGVPSSVVATALSGGRVLVQIAGARRANSFNYYKQVVGTDAEPVKVTNTEGTQFTIENLSVGATVRITVTGVNDAGEGQPCEAVEVVVT